MVKLFIILLVAFILAVIYFYIENYTSLTDIKVKNFWIWFKDQVERKRFFYNMFISRNAWGAFSINSHINQHNNQPKIMYGSVKSAKKAAEAMSKKRDAHFSYYKCLYCDGYHIGKNRDNKIEGYDK